MANAQTELDFLRQRTGLSVPPNARLSYFEHHPVRDEMLRAKLVISPADLASFLRENGFSETAFTEQNRGFLGADDGEWDPQQHPIVVLAPPRQDSTGLYIGILKTGAEVQFYILWFTT